MKRRKCYTVLNWKLNERTKFRNNTFKVYTYIQKSKKAKHEGERREEKILGRALIKLYSKACTTAKSNLEISLQKGYTFILKDNRRFKSAVSLWWSFCEASRSRETAATPFVSTTRCGPFVGKNPEQAEISSLKNYTNSAAAAKLRVCRVVMVKLA